MQIIKLDLPLTSPIAGLEGNAEVWKDGVDFTTSSTGCMSKMSRCGGELTPFDDEKGPVNKPNKYCHTVRKRHRS